MLLGANAGLLPFVEETALYNAANFSLAPEPGPEPDGTGKGSLGGYVNSTVYNHKLRLFLCPSDPNAGRVNINSYHASIGTSTFNVSRMPDQAKYNFGLTPKPTQTTGMFTWNWVYRIADVTDGTTNTIAYSEALTGDEDASVPRRGNGTGNSGSAKGADQLDVSVMGDVVRADLEACNSRFASAYSAHDRGYRWGLGAMGYSLFNTVVPPNGGGGKYPWNSCRVDCCDLALAANYLPASSDHPGGVNVLMADGSVRFVKNAVGPKIWWAIGTRGNSETISSDAY